MRIFRMGLAALLVMAVPGLLSAQSLGEVAAKEKEKKKAKTSSKAYSDDDLKKAGSNRGTYSTPEGQSSSDSAQAPKADGAAADGKAADGKKEKSEDEARQERQAGWRKKLDKAQADVNQYQKAVDDLQAQISQSTNYYSPGRAKAMSDLEEAKGKLSQATQALNDLEDEGRRNGYR